MIDNKCQNIALRKEIRDIAGQWGIVAILEALSDYAVYNLDREDEWDVNNTNEIYKRIESLIDFLED